ncbi:DUF58 domain-containing protein [Bifidobacterium canis]|uniref:DUF58 domain-containing protein n=1 Tax=Bifidobacterium canis TaxID=2610880 RepID=A0A7K1J510_9BIFI|nr:DUF58 domain-containing protein [Bifidobacterium canis]MUH59727.1 hypothetical protein [Bifidobacterium canis]
MSSSPTSAHDSVRRKIEKMGTSLSLPTVRKALGILEGEHSSQRRGGNDDLLDIRPYEVGDEARQIDWKISAKNGRAMIAQRERLSSAHVYLLLDAGMQMSEVCASDERAYQIAANALCMFAALSLRRSDDISLVFGDSDRITRVPFHGGLAQFEITLDKALDRDWDAPRNISALLDYASGLRDRNALIVLATDDHALNGTHLPAIRRIAQTHPLVLIDVKTINPFDYQPIASRPKAKIVDGMSGRRVPAFLRNAASAQEIDTHRAYALQALERELTRCGSRMIHADSSEGMFHAFVRLLSAGHVSESLSYLKGMPIQQ